MKKATRLLILTAFVCPLLMATRAYAGDPGQGQRMSTLERINRLERDRMDLDPLHSQRTDPFNTSLDPAGFHSTAPDNNPLHLMDPIGNSGPDINRNDLFHRSILGSHDRFPGAGRPAWDPGSGGGTAPIDGGISLLLAAGLGLGIRKARARKQTV